VDNNIKYCNYDIDEIIDTGNTVRVYARFCEGELVETTDPITSEPKTEYQRTGIVFGNPILYFERNPVPVDEIKALLLQELNLCKGGRVVLPELA
jgi:hypothetical protein